MESKTESKKSLADLEKNLRKLVTIEIPSIYKVKKQHILLPSPLNQLVNTAADSLKLLENDVRISGGQLILSDAFRSYDMQMQAFLDWKTGKKTAYSPPPDHSFHEAGRAIDISLEDLGIKLIDFWMIAKKHGWVPIIAKPDSKMAEAWHFEYREYFSELIPEIGYRKAAYVAIRDIDLRDDTPSKVIVIQAHLSLQGFYYAKIDGIAGMETNKAILNFKAKYGLPIESTMMDPYFIALLKNCTYNG